MHTRLIEENMKNKIVILIVAIIATVLIIVLSFFATHFYANTKINGINCSFYTVEQTQEEINEQVASNEIYIKFANGVSHKILGKDIDLCLENEQELKDVFRNSKKLTELFHEKDYTLENSFSFNEEKLLKYLKSLPEFNEKSISAKNAYINFNQETHTVDIIPETIGNVNLEEAFTISKNRLKNGKRVLDFTICPEITEKSQELIETKNKINNILATNIHYKLKNGETVTINWSNWIKQDKQGNWNIEIEDNLKKVINSLAEKISAINSNCTFHATGIGNVKLHLRKDLREQLDTAAETERMKKLLGTGETYNIEPTYIEGKYQKALTNYLEIDLTRQKVWLYRNGKCIVSGNCVSANVSQGYITPTGMFYLDNKATKVYLSGKNKDGSKYRSFVNYWMPFNGAIGLHDATWRSKFGGRIYRNNGSHGCINLPYSVAKKIYENINYSTLIIVYKS